ncbi:MAG: V-type ATP synthase subunit F [Oscillospiraceae bacterium]|nr:V-type ATP synthase subunit F [Oscillospiraceae bacterium]
MKYFVITDSTDTQVGLRFAGIEGVVVRGEGELKQAIAAAAADPEIGVLLITEHLAALCAEQVAPLKLTAQRPLVVEIPDRHSAGRASNSIMRYVREAIGVSL